MIPDPDGVWGDASSKPRASGDDPRLGFYHFARPG